MTDQQLPQRPRVVPPPRPTSEGVRTEHVPQSPSLRRPDPAVDLPGRNDQAGTATGEIDQPPVKDRRYWATRPPKRLPVEPPPAPADDDTSPEAIQAWRALARWFEDANANARHMQDRDDLQAALQAGFPALLAGILAAQGAPLAAAQVVADQIHPDRFITDQLEYDLPLITSTAQVLATLHRKER